MRITSTQKKVLRNVARNTPFSTGFQRTLKSLEKKGLIRELESGGIRFWDLTDTGNALYIKVFNITPECW